LDHLEFEKKKQQQQQQTSKQERKNLDKLDNWEFRGRV
jgi:hypothetical protein